MASLLGFVDKDKSFSNVGVTQSVARPQTVTVDTLNANTINVTSFHIGETTFANLVVSNNVTVGNAIVFSHVNNDNTVTILSTIPLGPRTYTIPDAGSNSSFVMTNGNQTLNGVTTFAGGILLPTLNGTPTNLNYYEQLDLVIPLTAAIFTVPVSATIHLTRVGRQVSMTIESFFSTGNGVSSSITAPATSIPSRFAPSIAIVGFVVPVVTNSTFAKGSMTVSSNGAFGFAVFDTAISPTSLFTGPGTCGIGEGALPFGISITWSI